MHSPRRLPAAVVIVNGGVWGLTPCGRQLRSGWLCTSSPSTGVGWGAGRRRRSIDKGADGLAFRRVGSNYEDQREVMNASNERRSTSTALAEYYCCSKDFFDIEDWLETFMWLSAAEYSSRFVGDADFLILDAKLKGHSHYKLTCRFVWSAHRFLIFYK